MMLPMKNISRRELVAALPALALATGSFSHLAAQPTAAPLNLLFLTVDDMNWSIPRFMNGFIGGKLHLTPNLDALAARSHRFIHNRTVAAICQPSREAMMTGLVPHRSGGLGFIPVHPGTPTLVTQLQSHGYFAAGIHKLEHMQPQTSFPWDMAFPGAGRAPSEYATDVSTAIAKAQSLGKPFIINCNLNDPHRPFYSSQQAAAVDHNETGEYHVPHEVTPEEVDIPPFLEDLPEIRRELAQYANSTQRMDITLGKVLAALDASGAAANTVIFFSADHGMPFPYSKASVYECGTRTPALLHYPGMATPHTFTERTANVDYTPTLLDLLHVPIPSGPNGTSIDGISWMPLIRGEVGHRSPHREFLVTNINSVSSGTNYPQRAVQDDRYSLVVMPWSDGKLHIQIDSVTGLTFPAMKAAAATNSAIAARVRQFDLGVPIAFYDVHADPGQRINLINAPEHRNRIAKMKAILIDEMTRTNDPQLANVQAIYRGEKTVVPQSHPVS